MLVLGHTDVSAAFPMKRAIPLMAESMRLYSAGQVTQPLRTVLAPPSTNSLFAAMPCHIADGDHTGYGLKAILLEPDNARRGLDTHVGMVMVFDPATGRPAALLEGGALTAVRTAAASAAATDALARPDAGDLALLGSGVQARSHLEAMAEVRDLRRVRVWSRTPAHAERFRAWAADRFPVPVETVSGVGAALDGADLVCTTLACDEPVVEAGMLAPGAHVNAVGAVTRKAREFHAAAVAACAVFVDSRESAAAEAADVTAPVTEGLAGEDLIRAELGEVLLGSRPGREGPEEITFYKSLGLAVQDILAGFDVLGVAAEQGLGVDVAFG